MSSVCTWEKKIQLGAVITWSNIVRYYIHNYTNWDRISIRCWITKDTPYLALTGELRGIFCEYMWENWPRYNGTALYIGSALYYSGVRPGNLLYPRLHVICLMSRWDIHGLGETQVGIWRKIAATLYHVIITTMSLFCAVTFMQQLIYIWVPNIILVVFKKCMKNGISLMILYMYICINFLIIVVHSNFVLQYVHFCFSYNTDIFMLMIILIITRLCFTLITKIP